MRLPAAPPCSGNRLGTSFVYPKLRGTPDIFSSGVPRAVLLARGRHCFAKKGCAAGYTRPQAGVQSATARSAALSAEQAAHCRVNSAVENSVAFWEQGFKLNWHFPKKPLCFLWKCETVSFLSKGQERNGVTYAFYSVFKIPTSSLNASMSASSSFACAWTASHVFLVSYHWALRSSTVMPCCSTQV